MIEGEIPGTGTCYCCAAGVPVLHLEPQSRFGDKPLKFQVVRPQNGTAVLKGLKLLYQVCTAASTDSSLHRKLYTKTAASSGSDIFQQRTQTTQMHVQPVCFYVVRKGRASRRCRVYVRSVLEAACGLCPRHDSKPVQYDATLRYQYPSQGEIYSSIIGCLPPCTYSKLQQQQ